MHVCSPPPCILIGWFAARNCRLYLRCFTTIEQFRLSRLMRNSEFRFLLIFLFYFFSASVLPGSFAPPVHFPEHSCGGQIVAPAGGPSTSPSLKNVNGGVSTH